MPGHPDDGGAALGALADIGVVRRLLDQAELATVRTARRHGRSWAEIATQLGVTRQSAWERWRELDESADSDVGNDRVLKSAAADVTELLTADGGVIGRAARESRRRATVVVPSVIGMAWDDALRSLADRRLVGVGHDPDGPPLPFTVIASGVVTDQTPEPGAKVPVGSPVTLWVERGDGSAGVREPRRPKPGPPAVSRELPDAAEEAVG